MIPLSLAEIAALTGGDVVGDPSTVVTAEPSLDSRLVPPGGLFVAVAGERVDGHDFADAASAVGAVAVLGTRPTSAPTVVVADPVAALGRLGRAVVDRLPSTTVLALTGSQGKTGTKDFLGHVLAHAGPTIATAGNYNNELGVPLTVTRAGFDTRFLVVEMGARGLGHIAYLCEIARPTIAGVLNIGTAHVGEFGDQRAIARAKGEIIESLPDDGVAILNADDPLTMAMTSRTSAPVLTFGERGDVTWRSMRLDDLGRPALDLRLDGEWYPLQLAATGAHQVLNAAAAAAFALAAGVGAAVIAGALGDARSSSRWRMEVHRCADGTIVVNDAYNANPDSMRAALEALAAIGGPKSRRVAVLGEMRELGEESEEGHRAVGRAAARLGIDTLVLVGRSAAQIAEGVGEGAGPGDVEVVLTDSRDDASAWVRHNVAPGAAVLVKASRGAALEVLAQQVIDDREGTIR